MQNGHTDKKSTWDQLLWPITFTVVGLGALTIAAILAARAEQRRSAEESGYDVENYDVVKSKPYITSNGRKTVGV